MNPHSKGEPAETRDERLTSWKEIAAWFGRTERTVQRWEQAEGLPVHRLVHGKRGSIFALTAELERWAESRKDLMQPEPPEPKAFPYRICIAAIVLLACGGMAWRLVPKPDRHAPRVVGLASYSGNALHPVFSPDGTRVVFSWDPEGGRHYDLYVKLLDVEPPQRLTSHSQAGAETDIWPAWSPDGRWIAFLRNRGNLQQPVEIVRTSSIGGAEKAIAEIQSPGRALPYPYLTWTPDSRAVVAPDKPEGGPYRLCSISADSGERLWLTNPPRDSLGDAAPAFSSEGNRLAFVRCLATGSADVMIQNWTPQGRPEGDPRTVCRIRNSMASSVMWTAGGRDLLYVTFRNGVHSLWRVPAAGAQQPQEIPTFGSFGGTAAISRQGDKLAYSTSATDWDLWTLDLTRSGAAPARTAPSKSREMYPQFSPDGRRFAFVSERSGRPQIWVAAAGGAGLRQVTAFADEVKSVGRPRWSPDGRELVAVIRSGGRAEVWRIAVEGNTVRRINLDGQGQVSSASWSRDGKRIYLACTPPGGISQIYQVSPEGGVKVQVTRGGGIYPLEGPVGGSVYYIKPGSPPGLWRTDGVREDPVLSPLASGSDFEVTAQGIWWVQSGRSVTDFTLHLSALDTGRDKAVTQISQVLEGGISVSPDGRQLLYTAFQRTGCRLWLVEDFR